MLVVVRRASRANQPVVSALRRKAAVGLGAVGLDDAGRAAHPHRGLARVEAAACERDDRATARRARRGRHLRDGHWEGEEGRRRPHRRVGLDAETAAAPKLQAVV